MVYPSFEYYLIFKSSRSLGPAYSHSYSIPWAHFFDLIWYLCMDFGSPSFYWKIFVIYEDFSKNQEVQQISDFECSIICYYCRHNWTYKWEREIKTGRYWPSESIKSQSLWIEIYHFTLSILLRSWIICCCCCWQKKVQTMSMYYTNSYPVAFVCQCWDFNNFIFFTLDTIYYNQVSIAICVIGQAVSIKY